MSDFTKRLTARTLLTGLAVGFASIGSAAQDMPDTMQMNDRTLFGQLLLDRLETRDAAAGTSLNWDATARYGGDYQRLLIRTEGEHVASTNDARVEMLWDTSIATWWSFDVGIREDFGTGAARTWIGAGLTGTAPGPIHVEISAYAGESARTAFRLKTEYDLLLTQRAVLQPQLELNAYGQSDPPRAVGSGVSDLELGLRLRYEIRRELAPYLGVAWRCRFGKTAGFARAAGESPRDFEALAGVRLWF